MLTWLSDWHALPTDAITQPSRISSQVSRADAILHWPAGGGIERYFFSPPLQPGSHLNMKQLFWHTLCKRKRKKVSFYQVVGTIIYKSGSQVGEFELEFSVQLVLASLMRKLQRLHPRKLPNQWIQSLLNHKSISQFAHLLFSALIKNNFNTLSPNFGISISPSWFDTPKCEFKKKKKRWWNHS